MVSVLLGLFSTEEASALHIKSLAQLDETDMQQEELAADGASEKITAEKILHGVKIKNIYGIPDDEEKAQMKNKKKQSEAQKALEAKK